MSEAKEAEYLTCPFHPGGCKCRIDGYNAGIAKGHQDLAKDMKAAIKDHSFIFPEVKTELLAKLDEMVGKG